MTDAVLRELESLAKIVDTEGWSAERGAQIAALLSPTGKPFVFGKVSWKGVASGFVRAVREAHGNGYIAWDSCRCAPCRRRAATIIVRDAWKRWKRETNHRDLSKVLAAPSRHCRVCKLPIVLGHPSRTTHDGRADENNCKLIYMVMTLSFWRSEAYPYWRERCGGKCEARCGRDGAQVDHIVPLVDGGSPWPENLQLLCEACHGAKTAAENSVRMRARVRVLDDVRMARDDRPRLFA